MLSKLYLILFALFFPVSLHSAEGWRRRNRRRCHAVSCAVSGWSNWSQCSHRCGGTQTRTRAVTLGAACGGSCPYALSDTRPCNRDRCSNGGTPLWGHCSCLPGYSGTCCEGGNYNSLHVSYDRGDTFTPLEFSSMASKLSQFLAEASCVHSTQLGKGQNCNYARYLLRINDTRSLGSFSKRWLECIWTVERL